MINIYYTIQENNQTMQMIQLMIVTKEIQGQLMSLLTGSFRSFRQIDNFYQLPVVMVARSYLWSVLYVLLLLSVCAQIGAHGCDGG